MRQATDLHEYQVQAINFVLQRPASMLWLDIGLGKTIVALTAVTHWLDTFKIRGCLVLGTVKIIETVWEQEVEEWSHTYWPKVSLIRGTPKQRREAIRTRADIYLINYDQVQWLVNELEKSYLNGDKPLPFDAVIYDEVSKMKNATTKRGKAWRKILPHMKRRIGLTGTPASNGYKDLHGQYFALDGGKRLGINKTSYFDRWFITNPYSRKVTPRRGAPEAIRHEIADITLEMNRKDYLTLPDAIPHDVKITLTEDVMKQYKEFENDFFLEWDGNELEAFSAGSKSIKCRQLANGAVYVMEEDKPETRHWVHFHDEKLDVLEELYEELKVSGKNLLVCYQFKHDAERIKKRFPKAVSLTDAPNASEVVNRWNTGQISLLLGHPASMGHGINLQKGGHHIAWFGVPWDLELYEQANGRLDRQGLTFPVFIHRIIARGTVEERIARELGVKGATQDSLRAAIKQYRNDKIRRN